jgi:hypothetical protein
MKKKIYGFLLGAAMILISSGGVFSASEPIDNSDGANYCRWNEEYGDCMPISGTIVCLLYEWPTCTYLGELEEDD